jgi:hypothetical protein
MSDEQRSALIAQATAASKMPRAVWNKLQTLPGHSFASGTFPSDYLLKKALSVEAKLDMKFIDCCINGCRAYTRSYENDTVCYSCLEPRYASDVGWLVNVITRLLRRDVEHVLLHSLHGQGRPRQKFTYLSPINRLRSQHGNKDICARLRYPFIRTVDKGKYQDIWEGAHIKRLRKKKVEWAGQQVDGAGFYFEDDTHIALGLAMDGLPCFKRSKLDCWPILLTNYSLAPEVRTKREFQMCCGLIPGKILPPCWCKACLCTLYHLDML